MIYRIKSNIQESRNILDLLADSGLKLCVVYDGRLSKLLLKKLHKNGCVYFSSKSGEVNVRNQIKNRKLDPSNFACVIFGHNNLSIKKMSGLNVFNSVIIISHKKVTYHSIRNKFGYHKYNTYIKSGKNLYIHYNSGLSTVKMDIMVKEILRDIKLDILLN